MHNISVELDLKKKLQNNMYLEFCALENVLAMKSDNRNNLKLKNKRNRKLEERCVPSSLIALTHSEHKAIFLQLCGGKSFLMSHLYILYETKTDRKATAKTSVVRDQQLEKA